MWQKGVDGLAVASSGWAAVFEGTVQTTSQHALRTRGAIMELSETILRYYPPLCPAASPTRPSFSYLHAIFIFSASPPRDDVTLSTP